VSLSSERTGLDWCKKPMRVTSTGNGASALFIGEAGWRPIETLGRLGRTSNRQASEARERSLGEGSGQVSDGEPWKAETQGSIQRLVD
jgi:hypothetical protein